MSSTDSKDVNSCLTTAPVTPGCGNNSSNENTAATIDLTKSSPLVAKKKVAGANSTVMGDEEDHFFSSPVVEIIPSKATQYTTTTSPGSNRRNSVSTSASLDGNKNSWKDNTPITHDKRKEKKKKNKKLQSENDNGASSCSNSANKRVEEKNVAESTAVTTPPSATSSAKATTAANDVIAPSKKRQPSSSPAHDDEQQPLKKQKKRSFHDQILYTMLTTNTPYTLKSLAKATNTTIEQLNHAMLSFVDKGLVIVKEFPKGKKLYWATTVSLSSGGDNGSDINAASGAIQKELAKLLATPLEMNETKQLFTALQQRYRSIQEELQQLLAIPTVKEIDDDIERDEKKLKSMQDEIDRIRTHIRQQEGEGTKTQQQQPPTPRPTAGYGGGYYRMQQQLQRRVQTLPPDRITLKRKINHMLSEYKTRKRQCMDFINELADAMEKHPREIMTNDKILGGLDTDEMEWGWWLDCGSGKVFGTRPTSLNGIRMKKTSGGHRDGGKGKDEKGEEGEKTEPSVKIPAKYVDV